MTARSLVLVLQPWIYEGEGPPTSALAWRPEQGTEVLVLDKDDLSRRRSFLLPPFFHFHMGAGFEDASGAVRFDICQAPDPSIAVRTTVDLLSGVYRPEPLTVMALVTLSPDGRATLEPTGVAAEFPRTDPRSASGPRTFTLHAAVKSPERPLYQGVGMFDWRTGSSETFDLGEHHLIEEMVFTPRPGAVAEMDGFVIGPAINLKARASELLVFDARRLSAGPLCVWRADVVAPAGLHGGFTAA
jgi:carotenoid cleavage dioxygenase-like enzyme